jgi:hypothetical protein
MFKDSTNKISMMRIGFFTCLVIGSILALAGTVGAFFKLDDASTLLTTGTALMGTSGFAKAIQAKWEQPK